MNRMNRNQRRPIVGITLFALVLAMISLAATAAEFRFAEFTNTALPTIYAPNGSITTTLTNSTTDSPSTARVVPLNNFQDGQVMLELAVSGPASGTNGTFTAQIDLSAGSAGTYWKSNAISASVSLVGGATNVSYTLIPWNSTGGTNALTSFQLARWRYATSNQTNAVTVQRFRLVNFK